MKVSIFFHIKLDILNEQSIMVQFSKYGGDWKLSTWIQETIWYVYFEANLSTTYIKGYLSKTSLSYFHNIKQVMI